MNVHEKVYILIFSKKNTKKKNDVYTVIMIRIKTQGSVGHQYVKRKK